MTMNGTRAGMRTATILGLAMLCAALLGEAGCRRHADADGASDGPRLQVQPYDPAPPTSPHGAKLETMAPHPEATPASDEAAASSAPTPQPAPTASSAPPT
jgi:hypothetical protein